MLSNCFVKALEGRGGVFCQKANFGFLKRKKVFCEKANFGQNSAKICLCSQNLPFYRIIEIGLKTGIFDPFSYKVAMEKTNFLWLKLFFWISSSVPLQWLSSKKLMECLKGQRFQFLGMFQWFCEKANFGWISAKICLFTEHFQKAKICLLSSSASLVQNYNFKQLRPRKLVW